MSVTVNSAFKSESHPSDRLDSLLPLAATPATFQQNQREVDRIAILKIFVPSLTILVFVTLVLWPIVTSKEGSFTLAIDRLEERNENAKLIKPRVAGIDKNNHPFNIAAETAFRKSNDDKDYYLKNLLADMKMSNGTDIEVQATQGMYDSGKKYIELDGAVEISTKTGFTLTTDQASLSINDKIVTGENGVSGKIPFGKFQAQSFHVDVDQEIIKLKGQVKLHFDPDKTLNIPDIKDRK